MVRVHCETFHVYGNDLRVIPEIFKSYKNVIDVIISELADCMQVTLIYREAE
jgi:hypothetical protein